MALKNKSAEMQELTGMHGRHMTLKCDFLQQTDKPYIHDSYNIKSFKGDGKLDVMDILLVFTRIIKREKQNDGKQTEVFKKQPGPQKHEKLPEKNNKNNCQNLRNVFQKKVGIPTIYKKPRQVRHD